MRAWSPAGRSQEYASSLAYQSGDDHRLFLLFSTVATSLIRFWSLTSLLGSRFDPVEFALLAELRFTLLWAFQALILLGGKEPE